MSYKQLTLSQRYEIRAYLQAKVSLNQIANFLGVHRSTISREVKRNQTNGGYYPEQANHLSNERRRQARKRSSLTESVKHVVHKLLELDFSPEQISGYLEKTRRIQISHETIYQYIWSDKASGGTLYKHLRWALKKRRKRYGTYDRRGQIPDRLSIEERPVVVDTKQRIGDWEVDTMIGKNHKGVLVTAVERKSKYLCVDYVPSKRAELVSGTLIQMLMPFKDKVLTITVDNGKEFALHKTISKELEADVYFAHPYRAWERGLIENTNGLLRQYFPKKTPLTNVSKQTMSWIETRLNIRPRKSLEYRTPLECFLNITVALGT